MGDVLEKSFHPEGCIIRPKCKDIRKIRIYWNDMRSTADMNELYEIRKPAHEKEVNEAMASERYLNEFIYAHIDSNGD